MEDIILKLSDLKASLEPIVPAVKIVESPLLTDTVEDWSAVRSPSRARRRRRLGHRQNIVYREVPKPGGFIIDNILYMHPETARQLRERIGDRISRRMDNLYFNALSGGHL